MLFRSPQEVLRSETPVLVEFFAVWCGNTIDPIALRLGPISIHWYAICIVSGLLLAVYLAQRLAPEKGINPEHILDFILLAFPIAIVGARLYYVIFQWSYYSQNPSEIFAIWNGGIAIYGGLIAGAAVLYWFAKRHAIAVLDLDRKSTRLNSSHIQKSRMPSSA